jgi:hypothetical protein
MSNIEREEYKLEIAELKEELQEAKLEIESLKKKNMALEFCVDIAPVFEKMFVASNS